MPYNESTGAGVPDRIKGKKKRRQFAHVWNRVYAETGDEGRAFAAANSVYNQSKKTITEEGLNDNIEFQDIIAKLVDEELEEVE